MAEKPDSIPKDSPESSDGRAESVAFWSTIAAAVLGAILLLVAGRDAPTVKSAPTPEGQTALPEGETTPEGQTALPEGQTTPEGQTALPEPLEPSGVVESAPTRFVWKPSGDDVDLTQVIVYRGDLSRIWESAPTESSEVTIPLHAFNEIYPFEPCFWRVREVTDGRPRAASGLKGFKIKNPPRQPPQEGTLGG